MNKDGFDTWKDRVQGYVQIGALLVYANLRYWLKGCK